MKTGRTLSRLAALSLAPLVAFCGGESPSPHAGNVATAQTTTVVVPPASSSGTASSDAPPTTPKKPVSDTYFGKQVTDDYRWLEDGKDPAVKAWSDAENKWARKFLDAVPQRAALAARVKQLLSAQSPDWFDLAWRGKRLFAMKDEPPKQQPLLVVLANADKKESEKVVVDPNKLDDKGGTTIDWYVPSHDGKLVAVSLSSGGSESGTVHVFDVDTGKERDGDEVPRAHGGTAGGSLAWMKDGSGFFYTRYPHEGERKKEDLDFYQQVYFHKLGLDSSLDQYVIGDDFPRIAEIELQTSDDGQWLMVRVANGDGGEFAFHLAKAAGARPVMPTVKIEKSEGVEKKMVQLPPKIAYAPGKGPFVKIADFKEKVIRAELGKDGNVWIFSRDGAPKGKLAKVSPGEAMKTKLAKAKAIVPEGEGVIEHVVATKSHVYVSSLVGGPNEVRVYDGSGKSLGPVPILDVSAVQQIVALDGDDVLVRNVSFLSPPGWYRFTAKDGKTAKTALFTSYPVDVLDTSGAEVLRDTCTSKDGTKVPINILRRKGTALDGETMTLLYGYGGYGVSLTPRFRAQDYLWLEQGGVFAMANLRGGGEMGEAWHLAGNLTKKQNVFDDFIGCAHFLIDKKYTREGKLAIRGGSNGGLLMGAALTQAPSLFAAVVSHVGIYDMLRVELTPNGAFNVTEFGTAKDEAQFAALYAYSPYHHVTDGTSYPAVLMLTGANDPRVDPYNSRKMIARLQAANASGKPILLRTSGDTGHGMGTPLAEWIDEETDVYSFLFANLGHTFAASPAKK
jgi:prolyl oligopeptidase